MMAHDAAARMLSHPFPTTRPPDWAALRAALRVVQVERPIELHLVRHGETEPNRAGLVSGSQDVDLSVAGREQASALGRALDGEYSLVVTSTMKRARDTIELALAARGVRAGSMLLDARLNERALGEREGKPAVRLERYAAGDLDWAPPGGESYREVARRALWFLLDVALWAAQRREPKVLVSTHSGPLRMLVATLDSMEDSRAILALTFENASVERRSMSRLGLPPFLSLR